MKDLQPLFEIDPLLLRLFVKQVSISDLEFLCGKVPTSILIMRLAQEAQQKVEVSLVMMFFYTVSVIKFNC